MKLESIKIKNIRSIKNLELTFPESTILFGGDVGSGKSSVLKAVEFGLFGTLGDLPGDSLLRRGQKTGFVELTFNIDGEAYMIHRKLSRSVQEGLERVYQPEGWIMKNDVKTEYTTTELRLLILDLLKYSISRYKAHNKKCIDIYRYTVYTPQEEIKEILLANPKERFSILKDVLEIEKYEHTLKNLEKISKSLNKDIRNLQIKIDSIGNPEDEIPLKEDEIKSQKALIAEKDKKIVAGQKELDREKKAQESIQESYNEYSKKALELNSNHMLIQNNNNTIKENQSKIIILKAKILEKQKELNLTPEIKLKTEKNEEEIEHEIAELKKKDKKLTKKNTELKKDVSEIQELLKNNKCPRCKQTIHEKERFDGELLEKNASLEKLNKELQEVGMRVNESESLKKKIQEYEKTTEKINRLKELIEEKKSRMGDLLKPISKLKMDNQQAEKQISNTLKSYKIKSLEEYKAHEGEIKKNLENQKIVVDNLQFELITFEKNKSSLETELKALKKEQKKLIDLIESSKVLKEKAKYITSIAEWISNSLLTMIRDIERTNLTSTAEYFDQYFREWFNALVEEENIEIRIDPENFQPIVYIDGYESPFRDMSGGEKSALSLAYRLALNKVILTKHPDVKTRDLLILDEPTDGFSEAQVSKMQDILDNLNMKQMIIISHERTLDSFVADIYEFKKLNHSTKVLQLSKFKP